jgi:hypothetical protein
MSDKGSYILAALSQRRDLDRENAEPVEEVLAKATLVDFLLQVPIGCGYYPYINPARAGVADPFKFLFLQHAEQLGLHRERHFADFIEE